MEYQPENQELAGKMDGMKAKVGQIYFDEAVKFMNQGKYYPAMKRVERIRTYAPGLQDDPIFKEFLRNFCKQLMERADKYAERIRRWSGSEGGGHQPLLSGTTQKVLIPRTGSTNAQEIHRRFDFSSPSNDKDAQDCQQADHVSTRALAGSPIPSENLQSILRRCNWDGLVDEVGPEREDGIDTFIWRRPHFPRTGYAEPGQSRFWSMKRMSATEFSTG